MRTTIQIVNRSVFLLAIINFAACSVADESPTMPNRLASAKKSNRSSWSSTQLNGVAKPLGVAEMPPAVTGIIATLHVKEGQPVVAGQLLVSLQDAAPRAAVRVAEVAAAKVGAINYAKIQANLAKKQLERARVAFQRGASSQFEIDEKHAAHEQAQALLVQRIEEQQAAQAELAQARAEFERYAIRAPFDGEIVHVHARKGAAVEPTRPIVTVVNRETLKVEMHLPLSDYGSVKTGSVITLLAGQPVSKKLTARVTFVSPLVSSASRTFRCVMHIDNNTQELPAGFSVSRYGTP